MIKIKLWASLGALVVGGVASWHVLNSESINRNDVTKNKVSVLTESDQQDLSPNNKPESFPSGQGELLGFDAGDQFFAVDVPVIMGNKTATYNNESNIDPSTLTVSDPPQPKNMNLKKSMPLSAAGPKNSAELGAKHPYDDSNKAATSIIDGVDFDGNAALGGFYNIPADPHGASGPNHVVNVINTSIQMFLKDGTLVLETSLKTFFNSLSPATNTFDPKIIYDQYEDRWLVVTLERTVAPDTSFVFLAVSDTSDPTGTWNQISIDTKVNIGGTDHWLDYPGFAVDEEAIYVTGNMFSFAGNFGGNRIVIVDKGVNGGFYDGTSASANIYDPIPPGFFAATHQPAHTFGLVPGSIGTWMVRYSGLSSTVTSEEALQIIRIDNPLGAVSFSGQFVFIGEVDNTAVVLSGGPQAGGAADIDLSDRRVQNAVWRNDRLYVTTVTSPGSGPDAGQTTAYWSELDTTNSAQISPIDGGHIGAEDLFPNAYTGYASIAVDQWGNFIIGFTATSAANFPGSYYVTRNVSTNTVSNVETIRDGLAAYERTFGSGRNRWGDYSSVSVDPVDNCFWVYNKHAITQGTTISGENGRWGTAHASVCSIDIPPTAVNDSYTVVEDSVNNSFSVTNNDIDPDFGPINVIDVGNASDGTTSENNNFAVYQPDINFCGNDSFTYTLNGGSTATVSVTVSCVNDYPTAVNDNASTNEDVTVSVAVLAGDSDPDEGDTLSVTSCSGASNGSVSQNGNNCDFTPAQDFSGQASFNYAISDGNGGSNSASVTVTVNAVNDDPTAVSDNYAIEEDSGLALLDVTDNDTDVEGDSIILVGVGNSSNGLTGQTDNNATYTPADNYCGADSFTYNVNGGSSATVNVTINCVDDVPTIMGDFSGGFTEDSEPFPSVFGTIAASGGDPGEELFIPSSLSGTYGDFLNDENGNWIYSADNSQANIQALSEGQSVEDVFTVFNADGVTTQDITITITGVNDDPTAVDDTVSTDEDVMVSVAVLNGDSDPDTGDTLTVTSCSGASNGVVVQVGSTCQFTPALNFNGEGSFNYTISDGNGGTDLAAATVVVSAVNDQPTMAVNSKVYVSLADINNPPAQNLACQFDFGPDDEDIAQSVAEMNVTVVNDPNNVLTAIDVDNTGALSYSFSGNSGEAELTVSLQDDGGDANGGVDTSTAYTFLVSVQDYVFRSDFESELCQ